MQDCCCHYQCSIWLFTTDREVLRTLPQCRTSLRVRRRTFLHCHMTADHRHKTKDTKTNKTYHSCWAPFPYFCFISRMFSWLSCVFFADITFKCKWFVWCYQYFKGLNFSEFLKLFYSKKTEEKLDKTFGFYHFIFDIAKGGRRATEHIWTYTQSHIWKHGHIKKNEKKRYLHVIHYDLTLQKTGICKWEGIIISIISHSDEKGRASRVK